MSMMSGSKQGSQRLDLVLDFKTFFDRTYKANVDHLSDKSYHRIYEVLFKILLVEKSAFLGAKKTTKTATTNRLVECGEVIRVVIKAGASKLKPKTVEAVVDHIIQTLPRPEAGYCEPIIQHYFKALASVFDYPANAEHLKASKWVEIVNFCLEAINQYLGDNEELSHSFSGLGTNLSDSLAKAAISIGHRQAGGLTSQNVPDIFQTLLSLVSAPNAPLDGMFSEITGSMVRFLQFQGTSVGQVHQLAFSILNEILRFIRVDHVVFTQSIACCAVPIISRFWQGKTLAKDEMLNSVRDEMFTLLFSVYPHLESAIRRNDDNDLLDKLVELLDSFRGDYGKRNESDQLKLDDLQMADFGTASESRPFRLHSFLLRSHNSKGERNWAHLQIVGLLEKLVSLGNSHKSLAPDSEDHDMEKHPRKRQRLARASDRLLDPLRSKDEKSRLAGLQVLPFVLQECELSAPVLTELLAQLHQCAGDKRGSIGSWALLAIASCTHQKSAPGLARSEWTQLWQVGIRSLTFSTTCRAASAQLHAISARMLVGYHDIGEDIDTIIKAADTSGPALICDSSISLMAHMLQAKVTEAPGSSFAASQNVIRWLFSRWNPVDRSFAAYNAIHVQPRDILVLIRTCLGLRRLHFHQLKVLPCGSIAQAWQHHLDTQSCVRYLLLLDDAKIVDNWTCPTCPKVEQTDDLSYTSNTSHFLSIRKLILELLLPKCSVSLQGWRDYLADRSSSVYEDIVRSFVYACITMSLVSSHYANAVLHGLDTFKLDLKTMCNELVAFLVDVDYRTPQESAGLRETLLQSIEPYLPPCRSAELGHFFEKTSQLTDFMVLIADHLKKLRAAIVSEQLSDAENSMDIDEDFPSSQSQTGKDQRTIIPRHDLSLSMSSLSFYATVSAKLILVSTLASTPDLIGFIPSVFIDYIISLTNEDLILSRTFVCGILEADLSIDEADAAHLVERIGEVFTSAESEFDRNEVAWGTCLDVLTGTALLWSSQEDSDIATSAGELYHFIITRILQKGIASPNVQKRLADLLLLLMKNNNEYGNSVNLSSPRSILFKILKDGNASVKFHIGALLPKIFKFFVLKNHEDVFVDVLDHLPNDPDWLEGISFRVFLLSKLASNWPTLLRRCIYHIFEVAGLIPNCIDHSRMCLQNVASALKVDSPQELLALFAPQVLYTWLLTGDIKTIPYQIFGFPSLRDLVNHTQAEAAAIMIMRGQEASIDDLASILGIESGELLQRSFGKIIAYTTAHDISIPPPNSGEKYTTGETRLKKRIGTEIFNESMNEHFADIIATLFTLMDPEVKVEKYFLKKPNFAHAATTLKQMKELSSSDIALPAFQQPAFRVKYLCDEVLHVCSRVPRYEANKLFTPAMVTFVARKLFDTIHPALGSLHACTVLRKIRILIALAGPAAVEGYPLEMLLHSIRPFVIDSECADDTIGILRYLLEAGSKYLVQEPSFVVGTALATLGSLREFCESAESNITQGSQQKNTVSKVIAFRTSFSKYLESYKLSEVPNQLLPSFEKLLESTRLIAATGNADVGTPESDLLVRLLTDEQSGGNLLTRPSRDLALSMLCSDFRIPTSFRTDILGKDDLSVQYAAVVWKSCKRSPSSEYMTWAARVLGRAFAASGHVHEELLQESSLTQIKQLSARCDENQMSSWCLLNLLRELTLNHDPHTSGLAETALRVVKTMCDEILDLTFQNTVPTALNIASSWEPYQTPPSDLIYPADTLPVAELLAADSIDDDNWLVDLSAALSLSVVDNALLTSLVPILREVKGFADQAFPFIVHLVLSQPSSSHGVSKTQLSSAIRSWFGRSNSTSKDKLKMLVNCILYLRTQPLEKEKSAADRSHWLDIDYLTAATSASKCGMFKTALLFAEEYCSQPAQTSRRSSSIRDIPSNTEIPNEILLTIFENIDDPDLYYGVQQNANLTTILSRFEYEKDGLKSLAFRGAQYDNHIRTHNSESSKDVQSLVKALDVLNLSGLSHSLLQGQQTLGMTPASLESMFRTARKLEQWDLPVPSTYKNNSVTVYKAFQAVNNSVDAITILKAINEGLECTMHNLVQDDLSATALHDSLQTLASLVELDEVITSRSSAQFEGVLHRFQSRSTWMKVGRFDDINQILSCRATTLGTVGQHPRLQDMMNIPALDSRIVEVESALIASKINRSHNAFQESLSLATSMIDLIKPCHEVGVNPEVVIHFETANALWDQGEMASSIGMLLSLDDSQSLKTQTIHIGRSTLLSMIGQRVSEARLEKADRVIKKYLEPALKELKGTRTGSDAGHVFHQFAVFCDQQLQDPDSIEDLQRLERLTKTKSDEVKDYDELISKSASSAERNKFRQHQAKSRNWLDLDEAELNRHKSSREHFLRQSLENYLLALAACNDYDSNALRFTALWLEHSDVEIANSAVEKHLQEVPSLKFAPLVNQLTSRLQDTNATFQTLLYSLILRICSDHPYHGMYQIYTGAVSKINEKDDSAVSRRRATKKLANQLGQIKGEYHSISRINSLYCALAGETHEKYKSGRKFALKESLAATKLNSNLQKSRIPPPTMQLALLPDCDYSKVPLMYRLESIFAIASGVSAPKIITALASDGKRYKQLVKGGNDDMRQDAIMEQVFEQVSELLRSNKSTRQRNLSIRTYKVLPLTNIAGVIEFVANTIPLHDYIMPAHQRYYPKDMKPNDCRKEIGEAQKKTPEVRLKTFRNVTAQFHPVMRYFFTEKFPNPDEWFAKRLAYTRSTAAISILGHVLGLGDRHGHNILLDARSGEVVHIDLGVAFEMGRVLPVPELVPFRLTRDIVDGMGITKTEGVFRRCCEFTLEAMRKEVYTIMTILDVLRYDPLYSWSMTPARLAKLQVRQNPQNDATEEESGIERIKEAANEPAEADRALTVVNKKLSKQLSVTATVNDLINQATDERNLAVLYSGWAAYA